MTTAPPLMLFLDRSTQGRRFVQAVKALVQDVQTIDDRYGVQAAEAVPDTLWISEASADSRILIGADRYILRNRLERHAVCLARARYVVFGNNNLSMKAMIDLFAANLPRIKELNSTSGPWVQRIAQHGMDQLQLNCTDLANPALLPPGDGSEDVASPL